MLASARKIVLVYRPLCGLTGRLPSRPLDLKYTARRASVQSRAPIYKGREPFGHSAFPGRTIEHPMDRAALIAGGEHL